MHAKEGNGTAAAVANGVDVEADRERKRLQRCASWRQVSTFFLLI